MISGAHVVVYSKGAETDRAFFRDVLGFKSVDAGHGWLIFALPTAEAAFHPSGDSDHSELYLMCDDLKAEIASLARRWQHRFVSAEAPAAVISECPNVSGLRKFGLKVPRKFLLHCASHGRKKELKACLWQAN